MGSDIYGRVVNEFMNKCRETGRPVRYVHQENHHQVKGSDTRGGVYGELNAIDPENLTNFVGFMPQEAQVVQVGMAYRSNDVLPNCAVLVKGPHTIFNEHARDHMKYAAYRYADNGEHANHLYLFDGGSLAFTDKRTINGQKYELQHARVGEHHNTPEYSTYAGDSNTVMATPIDMNMFQACFGNLMSLHDKGRMCISVVPTASFGMLHPKFVDSAGNQVTNLTQNDIIKARTQPSKTRNSTNVVVISWGPDTKWIAKTLTDQGVEATLIILPYMKAPNALVNYMKSLPDNTDVITVDPNPD